jgi:hypothetical protein
LTAARKTSGVEKKLTKKVQLTADELTLKQFKMFVWFGDDCG